MSKFITTAWIALIVLALTGCAQQPHEQKWAMDYIGPNDMRPLQFSGVKSSSGVPESSRNFLGKVVVLYFGYTHCPDVCPTTMAHLARAVQSLGPQGKDVEVLFVTVDPKRDTPAVLNAYVHAFLSNAIGLSGTVAQTKALADRYHVSYSYGKPDAHGDYVVNHSAAIYIFGPHGNGRLIGTELTPPSGIAHDVRQLLADAHRNWWQELV
ncbi:MAG: cytochrome c oxidase assembly protein [Thiomonas sp. 20-64-5]|nr:MAG: cytochrome c oxidase assembly protein [Thiomonas sp. 20-64-5]